MRTTSRSRCSRICSSSRGSARRATSTGPSGPRPSAATTLAAYATARSEPRSTCRSRSTPSASRLSTTAAFSTSPCREQAIRPATRRRGRTMEAKNEPHDAPTAPPQSVFPVLDNIPQELPILPLRGMTVFPLAVVPLQVGQPRSLRLVDDVMREGRLLGLVGQRRPEQENPGPDDCYTVGTVGRVVQLLRQPEGGLLVAVQGLERIRIAEWTQTEPYMRARINLAPDTVKETTEIEALRRLVAEDFRRLAAQSNQPDELVAAVSELDDPRALVYIVA